MPEGLKRYHQTGDWHLITFSCFRKRQILSTPDSRNTFLRLLDRTREPCEGYWVPHPRPTVSSSDRVGYRFRQETTVLSWDNLDLMPEGLKRYHQTGDWHFITFNCFRKRQILSTPEAKNTFLKLLDRTRELYKFEVGGYVVMPDHVHLILSEPELKPLATALQIIKQRFSKARPETEVWEERYHDFNIKSFDKFSEKLHYIHGNPVKRGLVQTPEAYEWSSYQTYTYNKPSLVQIHHPTL